MILNKEQAAAALESMRAVEAVAGAAVEVLFRLPGDKFYLAKLTDSGTVRTASSDKGATFSSLDAFAKAHGLEA